MSDTIFAVIVPENDPPKIAALPDTVMYENDSLWLKFGPFTSDVDDSTLKFTITAVTNDDKMTILPMGIEQEYLMSSSIEDSILFVPSPLWSKDAVILVTVEDEQVSDTSSFCT